MALKSWAPDTDLSRTAVFSRSTADWVDPGKQTGIHIGVTGHIATPYWHDEMVGLRYTWNLPVTAGLADVSAVAVIL